MNHEQSNNKEAVKNNFSRTSTDKNNYRNILTLT